MCPKPKLIGGSRSRSGVAGFLASLRSLLSQCYMLMSVGVMLGKRKT